VPSCLRGSIKGERSEPELLYFSEMKKNIFILLSTLIAFSGLAQKSKKDPSLSADIVLNIMQRVADWQLESYANGFRHPKFDWTNAAAYTGLMELAKISADKKYADFLLSVGNDLNWNTGPRRFHADDYCIAQTYANLFMIYKDRKMIDLFQKLADSIIAQPHTESLEWKNNIANREWAWCDALFMGPTALAYLSTATGEQKYLDIATSLWNKTTDYLYDRSEHLYFRDQTFFDKRENNGKKVFWSRGNGWVLAGLVRVLENMPENYPQRKNFEKLYKDMAKRIAGLQQPDGSWHASLLDPASYPIKETSGTGFYAYSIMWGINHKLLKKKKYFPVVEKAWKALTSSVHPDGMLGFVQQIGAAPASTNENSTEVYGVGSFLLTGSELHKFLKEKAR
jgi:unsaturated rhamnogalacturonyl hydrolase